LLPARKGKKGGVKRQILRSPGDTKNKERERDDPHHHRERKTSPFILIEKKGGERVYGCSYAGIREKKNKKDMFPTPEEIHYLYGNRYRSVSEGERRLPTPIATQNPFSKKGEKSFGEESQPRASFWEGRTPCLDRIESLGKGIEKEGRRGGEECK